MPAMQPARGFHLLSRLLQGWAEVYDCHCQARSGSALCTCGNGGNVASTHLLAGLGGLAFHRLGLRHDSDVDGVKVTVADGSRGLLGYMQQAPLVVQQQFAPNVQGWVLLRML
jgi:hypothetical protein